MYHHEPPGRDRTSRCAPSSSSTTPPTPRVFQFHFDEVIRATPGAVVLATSPSCGIQAVADPALCVVGTQFHPEYDLEAGNVEFLAARDLLRAHGQDALALVRDGPSGFDAEAFFRMTIG